MPSINTPDSYFDRDLCYEYCKCSKSPIRSVIGHSKSRKTKLELGLSIKVSKAKMMNLSNSKKSDKPIGSSGFSAEKKHICSYQTGDQHLTFGKDIRRLRPQYCSSRTKTCGIMIGQFNIGRFK